MSYEVLLTAGAEHDLEAIYDHIAEADGRDRAEGVLRQLLEVSERLAEFPERGAYPKELLTLGIREYRQLFFPPYRVIYRIVDRKIIITLIADGRRDMQALLGHRLLSR
jgi:toxin ParE1/3/4